MMVMREQDKHFLWALFYGTAIVLFWKGIWEGVGGLPYLENAWVSLFIALAMLTLSGLIFRELDPLGSLEKQIMKNMHYVHEHPKKGEFHFKYRDMAQKKDLIIKAEKLKQIEKGVLVFHDRGQEIFIPVHRIKEIWHKGKLHWKL